jgi:hypothetical protein
MPYYYAAISELARFRLSPEGVPGGLRNLGKALPTPLAVRVSTSSRLFSHVQQGLAAGQTPRGTWQDVRHTARAVLLCRSSEGIIARPRPLQCARGKAPLCLRYSHSPTACSKMGHSAKRPARLMSSQFSSASRQARVRDSQMRPKCQGAIDTRWGP